MTEAKKAVIVTLSVLAVIFVMRKLPVTGSIVDMALNG